MGTWVALHPLQDAAAALEVVGDGRERLVDLVGQGRGHLAQRREARHVHQLRLQLLQPGLGLLALGEVADEAREIALAAGAHLAHRQLHGKGGAVLTLADDHTSDADDPPLAGIEVAVHVAVMLLAIRLRHEELHVLPDDLPGIVAKHAHGGGAEGLDSRLLVDDHHGVRHRLQDGAEMRLPRLERLLGGDAFGDVAHDLGIPPQRAGLIPHGRHRDTGGVVRTVLTQTGTLLMIPAALPGDGEFPLRFAPSFLFWRVEHREMPPQDLVLAPAADMLGAGVPARDLAVQVEDDKGRVGDRADQEFGSHAGAGGCPPLPVKCVKTYSG
jgi:hypothetical protein